MNLYQAFRSWPRYFSSRCNIASMAARDEVDFLVHKPVQALVEMGAYERLWDQPDASFNSIAELFRKTPGAVPSDFVPRAVALEYANRVLEEFKQAGVDD